MDDPGHGHAARKGDSIAAILNSLSLSPGQGIFADDDEGNFLQVVSNGNYGLTVEVLYVQPRAGMTFKNMTRHAVYRASGFGI